MDNNAFPFCEALENSHTEKECQWVENISNKEASLVHNTNIDF